MEEGVGTRNLSEDVQDLLVSPAWRIPAALGSRNRSHSPYACSDPEDDDVFELTASNTNLRIENQRLHEQLQSRGARGSGGFSAYVDGARAHRSSESTWGFAEDTHGKHSGRHCAHCDDQLMEDATFCRKCGTRVEDSLRSRPRRTRSRSSSPEGHDHRVRELEDKVEYLMEENEHLTEQLNETTHELQDMHTRSRNRDDSEDVEPKEGGRQSGLKLWKDKVQELMGQHHEAQEKANQEHLMSLTVKKSQHSELQGKYSKSQEECTRLHADVTRLDAECHKKGALVSDLTCQCTELKAMLDAHMQSNREVMQQLEMELEAERLLRSSPNMKGTTTFEFEDFASTAPAGFIGSARRLAPSDRFAAPRAKELVDVPRGLGHGWHGDTDSEPESTVKPQRFDGGTTLYLQSELVAEADNSYHASPRPEAKESAGNSARLSARSDRQLRPSRSQVQPLEVLPPASEWSSQVVKMKELLSLARSELKEATVKMQPLIKHCVAN